MRDYISREVMSETPKCPYCGNDMIYHFNSEIIDMKKVIYQGYFACTNCHSRAPVVSDLSGLDSLDPIKSEAYLIATERFKSENRVLTLEELRAHKGFVWAESSPKIGGSFPAYVENGILFVDGDEINLNDNDFTYGKYGRCWLYKPTEEEMKKETWVK